MTVIRLRRYVERIIPPSIDNDIPQIVNELVLDKGLLVSAVPRTGEYVSYDRYEDGKAFMVKSVEHRIRMNTREADHDIIVVLA